MPDTPLGPASIHGCCERQIGVDIDLKISRPIVLDFLRSRSFADLKTAHGVKTSIARSHPYKASLNYDQIEAREDDPLACQCRGLVVATRDGSPLPTEGPVGDLVVLARSFDRFFNLGQQHAAKVDPAHPETRVFEKLDGTLVIVYHDPQAGEWCTATRSVPDADMPVDGFGDHTFRTLFEHALGEHLGFDWARFVRPLIKGVSYSFELTTPRNRVVVDHGPPSVHLLAMRLACGAEVCPYSEYQHLAIAPVAPSHPVSDIAAVLRLVNSRAPTTGEGVVMRGPAPHFHRVKVKSAAYVAAHRARDSACASPRALLHVVLEGQEDDVFPLLPENVRAEGERLRDRLRTWLAEVDTAATQLRARHGVDRKGYALAVQREGLWIAPMMSLWQGQATDARGWIERSKRQDGSWADSFLDALLERLS